MLPCSAQNLLLLLLGETARFIQDTKQAEIEPICTHWRAVNGTHFGTVKIPVLLEQLVSLLYRHLVIAIIKIIWGGEGKIICNNIT